MPIPAQMPNALTVAGTASPDLTLEQIELQRRQQMADALKQQALSPIEQQTVSGGAGFGQRVVPVSPMQGVAKLAQALMAGRMQSDVDKQYANVANNSQQRLAQVLSQAQAEQDPNKKAMILMGHPATAPAGIEVLKKVAENDPWGKINPSEYTRESLQAFNKSGNRADLVPAMKPGEAARLFWDQYTWGNISPEQRMRLAMEGGRLQNEGIRTRFDTGSGVGSPVMPAMPGNAPMPNFSAGVPGNAWVNSAPSAPAVSPSASPVMGGAPTVVGAPAPKGAPQGKSLLPPAMNPNNVTPKMRAELEKNRPEAEQAYRDFAMASDELVRRAEQLRDHPGLVGITGVRGMIPNVPGGDAANAQALLETLKTQSGFNTLQAMRNASKTGGALGNVSEREGEWLQNALASLQKAQSDTQMRTELNNLITRMRGMRDNASTSFSRTYGSTPSLPAISADGRTASGSIGGFKIVGVR